MLAEPAGTENFAAFGVSHSFSGRRWRLHTIDDDTVRALGREAGVSQTLAHLLAIRGIAAADIGDHLNPTLKRFLPEPELLADMARAVARVRAALDSKEKIAIFGDYDVDGSCSAAAMHDFLAALGPKPLVYIPDRMTEGYGPSAAAMRKLKGEGAGLVITLDCGATAGSAMAAAHDAGLDVIVLDHHACEDLPPVFAHVNPNRAGDMSGLHQLCAAGVTFLFLVALNRNLRDTGWYESNAVAAPDLMNALDLVGLATICDVVPLTGINRAFARTGLARLSGLSRPGFAALTRVANSAPPFTFYHAGFVFGPRINAGGRVGKCSLGVELLTSADAAQCDEIALLLDTHNRERQAIEATIIEEALARAAGQDNAPFLLMAEEGWHPGVVGIVAGRLKDRFGKPALVIGFEGGLGRGSARSIPGVDIGSIVRAARDKNLIESGGGHAMAAGFGLRPEQLDGFANHLAEAFAQAEGAIAGARDMDLDGVVSPDGATVDLVAEIARLGPFGAGNPEPVMVLPDIRIAFAGVVGKNHVRVRLGGGGGGLDAISFRSADTPLGQGLLASRGKRIHAAGRLRIDEWNGRTRVQLQLDDAAPAEG